MLPRDDLEKVKILKEIIKKFEKNREYKEQEVNEILTNLEVEDFALFRRELVNFNFFGKDSYKSLYWVKTYELTEEELEKIGNRQKKINKMDD